MSVIEPVGEPPEESPRPAGALANAMETVRETRESLSAVFSNPGLRRVELALAGSMIGDWAYATAVTVFAYGVGGVSAVGIWVAIRLALMSLTAPLASAWADRMPRKSVMILSDLIRAVLVTAAAACLLFDAPAAPIFVLATATSLLGTSFRCAQRALMPALAENPEELTASNGISSTIESFSFFVGPAVGALLIGLSSVGVVFGLNVITFVWSLVLVLGVHVPQRDEPLPTVDDETDERAKEGFLREISGGFRAIAADRDLLSVAWLIGAQTIVAGASAVFLVVMAVDILGIGAEGVGYLDSTLGIGAVLGGFWAISRARKKRLGQDMTIGVLLWALPLLLVVVWPSIPTALLAVALLGLANPMVDVNFETIVMRIAPDEVLGRVFGALESYLIGTMALGSALMPLLIHLVGFRSALAVVALGVAVLAAPLLPRMRRLDARMVAPRGLDLLAAVSIFAPLSRVTVEGLARALVPVPVAAGSPALREGEDSDRFYVIESGLVEVTQDGAVLRREGPGEFFGEIGLLRDVPRTATVTAVEDTVLLALGRDDFLAAVTGQREAYLAADDIVARRLSV